MEFNLNLTILFRYKKPNTKNQIVKKPGYPGFFTNLYLALTKEYKQR
jgi:hypothetical protein